MSYMSLAEFERHAAKAVKDVASSHERVVVTDEGEPAAILISADEWEELEETEFWRAQPGIHEDIAEAEAEIARVTTSPRTNFLKRRGSGSRELRGPRFSQCSPRDQQAAGERCPCHCAVHRQCPD